MRIHWLQHVPFEGLGSISRWADENNCPVTGSRLFACDALPPTSTFDLLVVMGGPMSVNDELVHPWLIDEKRFITRTMDAGKMILGVCRLRWRRANCSSSDSITRNPSSNTTWR